LKYESEIIHFIQSNRISTTEVADALGKEGVFSSVTPLSSDNHTVGRARCVFVANNSNYTLHEQIRDVQDGEVVIVNVHNCDGRAVMGDLMSKYLLLYRRAKAIVVDGLVRDASRLRREGYLIWAKGVTPLGCFNTPADPFPSEKEKQMVEKYDGGVAVCDGGGVVIIPKNRLNEDTLERLAKIELIEDIWYYCLDTLKWDTKKIVCDRAYFDNPELLPEPYRKHLKEISTRLDAQNSDEEGNK